MPTELGDKVPDFTLRSHTLEEITLSKYLDEKHVVFQTSFVSFTSGLTHQCSGIPLENCLYEGNGAQVLGINVSSVPTQMVFDFGLSNIPSTLLFSDSYPKGHVLQILGIYNEK